MIKSKNNQINKVSDNQVVMSFKSIDLRLKILKILNLLIISKIQPS